MPENNLASESCSWIKSRLKARIVAKESEKKSKVNIILITKAR